MENRIKCKMKINRIMFPKDKQIESGSFAIFTANVITHISGDRPVKHPHFGTVSLKGNVPHLREGDTFTITFGDAEVNSYGTSYTVSSVTKEIDPKDKKQLREYFNIMCGRSVSEELMKIEGAYEMLQERNDEELLKVKGIGKTRLEQIYNNIGTYSDISYAFAKLEPLGLTRKLISKICMTVGGAVTAVDICTTNPYSLIKKVKGVSFITADQIAIKCGLDFYSPIRIKSAIIHILEEAGEGGKSFLTAPQLMAELRKLVAVEMVTIDSIIRELINSGEIAVSADGMNIALDYYLKLEEKIANEIKRIRDAKSEIVIPEDWREKIKEIEEAQGWCYTEEQMDGIEKVLMNNLVVVSGKAGSGKSTVTNAMTQILHNYTIDMCCLSAKASQRLREVNKGIDAQTIHRLLGLGMKIEEEEKNILYSDIIILDEASMVSGTLFLKLLEAIPSGAKLIILGDDGQLTAIGNCAVFSDLMKSGAVVHVELTKIHRQAEKSAIITQSIAIRNQKQIYEKGFRGHRVLGELQDLELFIEEESAGLMELVKKKFIEDLRVTGNILEVQVISALKTRGSLSIKNINLELQSMFNMRIGAYAEGAEKVKIYQGDKVINLKNNYSSKAPENEYGVKKTRPVFNGNIGIVKSIGDKTMIVDFVGVGEVELESTDYASINLAYAISTHSSQGSQWKRVICAFDISSYVLLNVEILYTAVTRAMEHCSLIIENNAMQHALRTVEQKTKQTLLPNFLI